jgi:xanthine dehydrogenase accessory factor
MNELLAESIPFVAVTIVDAQGSVPQEVGAKMLVVQSGLYYGTVGGGKVEARAIKTAQEMLSDSGIKTANGSGRKLAAQTQFATWSLERDIGMTCGGSVRVYFEAYNTRPWHVTVFGAGHCANSLIALLLTLECRVTCIEPRQEWLQKLPDSPKLKKILAPDMPMQVASIPDGSFVVLMTMGHTTDKPILLEILRGWQERTFPYVGVIGSRAKAERLKRDIVEAGLPAERQSAFFCPMGLPIGTNQPPEIAISVVAQLMQVRDRFYQGAAASERGQTDCTLQES